MPSTHDPDLAKALFSFRQSIAENNLPNASLLLIRPYCMQTFWLRHKQEIQLSAVFMLSAHNSEIQVLGFVTDRVLSATTNTSATHQDFYDLAQSYSAAIFNLQKAIPLHSVCIPKPWGQEIWYTGMEDRGVCSVGSNYPELNQENNTVPLPWLLSMAPEYTHKEANLALLKILDPLADAVLGDLYFELHTEKHEVYVVTNINDVAWPEGDGGIRLGMNQEKRSQYTNDDAFRAAYLKAVLAYQAIRERIDQEPTLKLSDNVKVEEKKLRMQMQNFTALQTLSVGDAVVVQPDTPHSLLHGVRVVEFQSPVYERYIISFAQKVLTQKTWDSEQAIERMQLGAPPLPKFEPVESNKRATVERIVRFDEFNVWRVQLQAHSAIQLTPDIPYAICIGISGKTHVAGLDVQPEQACLIPEPACGLLIENNSDTSATSLIAAPGL